MPPERPRLPDTDSDSASDVNSDPEDDMYMDDLKDAVEDLDRDLDYPDENLDDETVTFGDYDPRTLSHDSEDDDCESVIYNKDVMEVLKNMAIDNKAFQ